MTPAAFRHAVAAADALRRIVTDPDEQDWWAGYLRGLRRHYHGARFGTSEEHTLWMSMATGADKSRHARGRGYRAGTSAMPISTALRQLSGVVLARAGGYARAAKLTPEQRREAGRKAVQARWAKAKQQAAEVR